MSEKPFHKMTDAELKEAHAVWGQNVEKASGFTSAYFAAKQLKSIVAESDKRGLGLVNDHPIKIGA